MGIISLEEDIMKKKPMSGIYLITNIENGKEYVGRDIRLPHRWGTHKSDLRLGKHGNPHLQRSYDGYGADAFVYEILEVVERPNWMTDEEFDIYLTSREKYHIDHRNLRDPNIGYNKLDPVNGRLGMKASEETKAKMSATQMGHKVSDEVRARIGASKVGNTYCLGRVPKEETKKKIAATLTGEKQSEERIEKRAAKLRGQRRTPEQCAKISAGLIGKKRTPEQRAKMSAWQLGEKSPQWGKTQSPETVAKRVATLTGMTMKHKGKPWSEARRAAQEKR